MNSRRHKATKNYIYPAIVIIFLLALVVLFGRSIWGVWEKNSVAREERSEALQELRELQERKAQLEAELERLSTERGVEGEIRDKFQVSKPGEETVILVDPKEDEGEGENNGGFWNWIKNLFR